MKKLLFISVSLAILILTGCNNIDNILSNYSNIFSKNNEKTEAIEIKKGPALDICNLFFTDSVVYKWRDNQIDVLYIQIRPEFVYCDGMVIDENYLPERVFAFIDTLQEEAIFLIQSMGSKLDDDNILYIINREYNQRGIDESKRKICLMRDELFLKWKQTYELKPPPPPPPPPEVIEIVEDEVEIENEIWIEDIESDENEVIEIEGDDDEEFFMVVENMPEFPGGDLGIMQYVQQNVKYPPIAKEYNITGKVYVSFIVERDGRVNHVKVVRGVDKNLDAEAIRVVKSLPNYKPGLQRGKAVRVMFTIPINFTLN